MKPEKWLSSTLAVSNSTYYYVFPSKSSCIIQALYALKHGWCACIWYNSGVSLRVVLCLQAKFCTSFAWLCSESAKRGMGFVL